MCISLTVDTDFYINCKRLTALFENSLLSLTVKGRKRIQISFTFKTQIQILTHKKQQLLFIYYFFSFRMKCTVVFLVLSMVVLMAEPGEGFLGLLISGAISGTVGSFLHGILEKHSYTNKNGFTIELFVKCSSNSQFVMRAFVFHIISYT